eukprot:gene8345-9918_t
MGKHGKRKIGGYEHVHTYNPKARESNERKMSNMQAIAIRRYQGYVDKIRNNMFNYVPAEQRLKQKPDPTFELKGAARVAQEFYRPPGWVAPVEARNLLIEYKGRMWEHEEGQNLLRAMLDLGLCLHNTGSRPKDAIRTFQETIEMDPEDHLLIRHRLLRCFLDSGDGLRARELLDIMTTGGNLSALMPVPEKTLRLKKIKTKNSKDTSEGVLAVAPVLPSAVPVLDIKDKRSCCIYNRAFIEHISLLLEEPGAQEEIRDKLLAEAYKLNPYTLWVIAHHAIFKEVVSRTTLLCDKEVLPHVPAQTIEDTLVFYEADLPLWQQTDGAIEWVQDYLVSHNLSLPKLPASNSVGLPDCVNSAAALSAESNEGIAITASDLHDMYTGMFTTAFGIIREQ